MSKAVSSSWINHQSDWKRVSAWSCWNSINLNVFCYDILNIATRESPILNYSIKQTASADVSLWPLILLISNQFQIFLTSQNHGKNLLTVQHCKYDHTHEPQRRESGMYLILNILAKWQQRPFKTAVDATSSLIKENVQALSNTTHNLYQQMQFVIEFEMFKFTF